MLLALVCGAKRWGPALARGDPVDDRAVGVGHAGLSDTAVLGQRPSFGRAPIGPSAPLSPQESSVMKLYPSDCADGASQFVSVGCLRRRGVDLRWADHRAERVESFARPMLAAAGAMLSATVELTSVRCPPACRPPPLPSA